MYSTFSTLLYRENVVDEVLTELKNVSLNDSKDKEREATAYNDSLPPGL